MRIAVVTAYCREARPVLERCIESVRRQTSAVEHILVADGHPQEWLEAAGVRHVTLDRAHDDFGDTPRLVGLLLAIREGCDAVQFLDADNLLYPTHAEQATGLLRETAAEALVLKRRFLRPDGSVLNLAIDEDESLALIDTNCYLFARRAFPTALKWALIPAELSFMGDRVFRAVLAAARHPVAVMPEPTIGYACWWAGVYRAAGEAPPPGCRDLSSHIASAAAWWAGLEPARQAEIEGTLGVKLPR